MNNNNDNNIILYGRPGTGKTVLLKATVRDFKGKVFYFSNEREYYEFNKELEINIIKGSHLNPSLLKDGFQQTDKTFVFIETHAIANSDFFNKNLIEFIEFIQENIDNIKNPLLIAFDEFSNMDLTYKMKNDKSLFLNLLELSIQNSNISTLFILQSIKDISMIYKSEYDKILDICKTINTTPTEKYSGEIRVRFPRSLHQQLSESADLEGISLNQYIVYLLTKNFHQK